MKLPAGMRIITGQVGQSCNLLEPVCSGAASGALAAVISRDCEGSAGAAPATPSGFASAAGSAGLPGAVSGCNDALVLAAEVSSSACRRFASSAWLEAGNNRRKAAKSAGLLLARTLSQSAAPAAGSAGPVTAATSIGFG